VGIRIFAHEDACRRMVKNRIALVGIAIVEGYAKEIWMVREGCRQPKAQLPTEQQLVIVDSQWVTKGQARDGFIQPISRHGNRINSGQKFGELLCLSSGIVPIEVQTRLWLPTGV